MAKNNVVCMKCGKQFYYALDKKSDISRAACPSCGGKDVGELTYSELFKNYGIYTGGG